MRLFLFVDIPKILRSGAPAQRLLTPWRTPKRAAIGRV